MIPAATVLTRLKQAAMEGGAARAQDMQVMMGNDRVGRIKPGRDGLTVELAIAGDADLDRILAALRTAILDSRARLTEEERDSALD